MKKQFLSAILICLSLTVQPLVIKAQTVSPQATVKISGEVTTPMSITEADLQKFKQTTVIRKDRDGNDHTYTGVTLAEILQKAGASLGNELKGENLTKYLLVEASDGYQAVFALPELDKAYTDRLIILADTIDGKPLAAGDGPFRIIIQDEKRPARCMKQVIALKIMFAK